MGHGEEKYVVLGAGDGTQTAAVFLYLPFDPCLFFFLSKVLRILSRERPRSRRWAAAAAGEECLDELCDRDPARAPGVELLREGEREGERLLRRPDPFERWEEELGREEALELPRAEPFPDPFAEPRPPLMLRLRFPSLCCDWGWMCGRRQLSPARQLPFSHSAHGDLCSYLQLLRVHLP